MSEKKSNDSLGQQEKEKDDYEEIKNFIMSDFLEQEERAKESYEEIKSYIMSCLNELVENDSIDPNIIYSFSTSIIRLAAYISYETLQSESAMDHYQIVDAISGDISDMLEQFNKDE